MRQGLIILLALSTTGCFLVPDDDGEPPITFPDGVCVEDTERWLLD